jgi:hypothetical protein
MAIAVVLFLSDEGQMSVGEVDAASINTEELQAVETFEEAIEVAEQITMGEAPPDDIEEDAFNESVSAPTPDPLMAE